MIRLRPVEDKDTLFVEAVFRSTREKELSLTNWTELQKGAFIVMQLAAQHADYKKSFPRVSFDIIEYNKQPVGRLYIGESETEIRGMDISLLPAFRGKGIGTQLIKDLIRKATAAQKIFSVQVEPLNPALQLYLRLGFVHVRNEGDRYYMEYKPSSLS